MGGRGASSGMSVKGKKYGTEYTTLFKHSNIKFVRYKDATSAKTPMETMTRGRIYVTIDKDNEPKYITYYDNKGKRAKQIDIKGKKHNVDGEYILPHTHKGYNHDEKGTKNLSPKESKMVDRVLKTWYYYNKDKY